VSISPTNISREFKTRIDVLELEETLAVVRVLEEGWGGTIDFTDVLLLGSRGRVEMRGKGI
jgi:hypothetical protein